MIDILLEPFGYQYMVRAMMASALIGAVCAFLSCYLIMKGWSLMGDALAHAVVPGVAVAYLLALPYALGAFVAGILAALGMAFVRRKSKLREDAVIGIVFTAFFALGLALISMNPVSVNIYAVMLGSILAVSDYDLLQIVFISFFSIIVLILKWKDLMLVFFDENHARAAGLPVGGMKILFFVVLSAAIVAALQAVGAVLVIALVITPGATAYLLTNRFGVMIILAILISVLSCISGVYLSYFLDGSTGGVIVVLQTMLFLLAFVFAPSHGMIAARRAVRRDMSRHGGAA